ncbi:MAG TPA: PAS domain-containing sensor histidine kinase [Candidatus Saccharimonadia bacterium]|nr:PAS domain-containing sensor histidine kinase [Candidatus Saccharimonadia bacterium]
MAKTRLEEDRAQTQAMINSLGEGLVTLDEHGAITTINQYAVEALGYQPAELIGQWFPKMVAAVDRYGRPVDQLSRPIVRALSTGQAVSDYTHYLTKTGDIIPVFVTVSPVLIEGRPAGAIEVFRDLTQERQLDVAKEEFVALASHQLRTPATAIKAILSMLAAGDFGSLTDRQAHYLQKALSNNEQLLCIIEDLLNAARVDAGKLQLDLDHTDLVALLREAAADHAPAFEAHGQTLQLVAPTPCFALADATKLRMVIDNLLSNASKYSPHGSHVTLRLTTTADQATIAVRDQGIGIAEADLPKLFTKFSRLQNELDATVPGTGLGLFLVKGIVALHQGRIEVTSRPGRGSTFTILLPLKPPR